MSQPGGSPVVTAQPSAPVPAHLLASLSAWPQLQALPLDPQMLLSSNILQRLHDMSRDVTAHLQWMQAQRQAASVKLTPQQRAAEAAGLLTPTQQADAQQYARLHAFLTQMQHKQQQVELTLQQYRAAQARGAEAEQPGSADQQMRDGSGSGSGSGNGSGSSSGGYPSQSSPANNSSHAQTQPRAQQPSSSPSAPLPHPHAASVPAIIPSSASGQQQQQLLGVPSAAPSVLLGASTPIPSTANSFEWLLPEGRRKLPGPRYTKERTIRKTLFGKVVLYWDQVTQQRVAIKLSNKSLLREGKTTSGNVVSENPLEELRFLRMLSRRNEADGASAHQQHVHPGQNHVLQLLDECEDEQDLWTVLEFCGKGEFFDIVCAANRFDEPRARLYFIQLSQGVAYMHAHLICHLDLSLENLLMTDDDVLKICDFGLARMMELDDRRHLVAYKGVAKNKPGKMGYMAPELFAGHSFYGHLCDVWAMGVILFICLTGVPPYQLPALSDQRFALIYNGSLNTLLTAWQMQNIMSPAAKDIISRMLCPPERRANIQQILAHPFVTGAPFPTQPQQAQMQPQQQQQQQQKK